jgi:hypothetical protein
MLVTWTTRSVLLIVACLGFQARAEAQFVPTQDLGPVHSVRTTITVNHGDYIAGGDGYGYCSSTGSYANERKLTAMAASAILSKLGITGIVGALSLTVWRNS